MFRKYILVLFSFNCLLFNFAFAQTSPDIMLLKDRRSLVSLPHYDSAQKKLILEQFKVSIDQLFVHQELKIKDFGLIVDPKIYYTDLESSIDSMSDLDFQTKLMHIINLQKDFHTWYSLPKPYACYSNFLPFTLTQVSESALGQQFIVNTVSDDQDYLKLLTNPLKLQPGDQVIKINSVPIDEVLKSLYPLSKGANPDALLREALILTTFRDQFNQLMPDYDETEITLINSSGVQFTEVVPWLSKADQDCLKPSSVSTIFNSKKVHKKNLKNNDIDKVLLNFKNLFKKTKKSRFTNFSNVKLNLIDTAEPSLKYQILKDTTGEYGYIQISSFSPEKVSFEDELSIMKKLLLNELKNMRGLILDLRGNLGGIIILAESMAQLFTPLNIDTLNFRLLNSPANSFYFATVEPESEFNLALIDAIKNNETYTKPLKITPVKEANTIGQYFFKPIALLTNSKCYSSCDIFSAIVQDHNIGKVYGEDRSTGGGGANNTSQNAVLASLPEGNKGQFKELPFNQNIGFAWRQISRVEKNIGLLIEDLGVLSDVVVRPTKVDILDNSSVIIKKIINDLNKTSDTYTSHVLFLKDDLADYKIDSSLNILADWADTDEVEFKSAQKTYPKFQINPNGQGENIPLPSDISSHEIKIDDLEVIGYFNQKRVWRKIFKYRVIPNYENFPDGTSYTENFSATITKLNTYNLKNNSADGWTILNNSLSVGNQIQYVNNVTSYSSLFLDLSNRTSLTLSFDALIDTELDYDFFSVVVVSDQTEHIILEAKSGQIPMTNYSFNLNDYVGKNIEIRFKFTSDLSITSKGVSLSNLKLN